MRFAMSKSCDDEREMSISEGPGHSTCGLAGELTARVERAEAELAAERKAKRELAEVISGQDKELAKERARLDHMSARVFEHRHHETGDHLGYEWTISSYSESEDVTLRDVIDAEMKEDIK